MQRNLLAALFLVLFTAASVATATAGTPPDAHCGPHGGATAGDATAGFFGPLGQDMDPY